MTRKIYECEYFPQQLFYLFPDELLNWQRKGYVMLLSKTQVH